MRHRRSRCRVSPFATIHSVRGVTCSRSSSSLPSRRSYVLPNDARPRHPHLKSVGPRRGLLTVLSQLCGNREPHDGLGRVTEASEMLEPTQNCSI
jgi:hypothetical protein